MSADLHKSNLFTGSGCLSQEALMLYAEGKLPEDDLKLVKDHLDSCALCRDAAEGISMIGDASDRPGQADKSAGSTADKIQMTVEKSPGSAVLSDYTDRINSRLRRKFAYSPGWKRASRQGPGLRNLLIPAAAAIIILIGIVSYFHFLFPESNDLAMVTEESTFSEEQEKGKAATMGGIFKEDMAEGLETEKPEPETTVPELELTDENDSQRQIENDAVAGAEETIVMEEELVMVEPEEKAGKDEAVVPQETVTAIEGVTGAGAESKQKFAASRAKSDNMVLEDVVLEEVVVDRGPLYPGGQDSLNSYLQKNLAFPLVFDKSGDTSVVVQFTVTGKGNIRNVKIMQSAGEQYDGEVLRVIRAMPQWIPGLKKGKNASLDQTLVIGIRTSQE